MLWRWVTLILNFYRCGASVRRSWGYQITGYYSITSRYGSGALCTWWTAAINADRGHYGLGAGHFARMIMGFAFWRLSPVWICWSEKSGQAALGHIDFDFGRPEVICFLISNALFWMDKYHIDGLRVDAVASMMELTLTTHFQWR